MVMCSNIITVMSELSTLKDSPFLFNKSLIITTNVKYIKSMPGLHIDLHYKVKQPEW